MTTIHEEIAAKYAEIEAAWPKTPPVPDSLWDEAMKLEMLKDIVTLTEPIDPEWFFNTDVCGR